MVGVGFQKTSNNTHLAEILKGITKTIHIESPDELDLYRDLTENARNISVTAGASTPQNLIEAVVKKFEN